MAKDRQAHRFGELLKAYRRRQGLTLVKLSEASGIDDGNLSRIERGARKPPKLPLLLKIMEKLEIGENSHEWHELLAVAARDRFESLDYRGITYLGYENPLHGLPPEQPQPHQFTLTQAALEIGRISASRGVKKITVETGDGSEWFFAIREEEGEANQR